LAPTYRNHLGTQDGDERRFLDSGAAFGATYKYVMTAVVNRDPLVESTFSEELEWEYLDDFPPAPPTELVILPEMGLARLLWDASDDDDVVGYVIHRRLLGGKYEPLNETPSPGSTYSDRTAASGRTYAYRVVAVDTQGNESDPSEEVEVRIP
jgi:hypothetical protein